MRRRRQAVPLDRDATGRYLPLLVAIMVYLAALALAGAMVASKLADRWDSGLSGALTVQLPAAGPAATEGGEGDPVAQQVVALLRDTPGVTAVERLDTRDIAALLEPWLGDAGLTADLPLPGLIAVTVDADQPPDLNALRRAVLAVAPGSLVDDHQRWLGHLLDLTWAIEAMAIVVVALVVLAAAIMVAFVTRMGLAAHEQAIEVLHLIGAQDSYVARQFQSHALSLGLRGGLIGLLCALPTLYLGRHLLQRIDSGLLPEMQLLPIEWSLLVLLPVASALVAMMTARITVLRTLARMP
ncbi:ABC transporter permease [Pelagibius sp.]|uniref:cell division protein FtsX n=1 Tax=Pelagibius sp. TaxID=1931238 RepID=UPI0026131E41|nr:FtsX-like permease family protein [Pelagibius sp.]